MDRPACSVERTRAGRTGQLRTIAGGQDQRVDALAASVGPYHRIPVEALEHRAPPPPPSPPALRTCRATSPAAARPRATASPSAASRAPSRRGRPTAPERTCQAARGLRIILVAWCRTAVLQAIRVTLV